MARYISVSKLKKALSKDYILPLCEKYIDSVPTEDVIPVKHGKWNDWYFENGYIDAFHCQECGHLFVVTQGREDMNFCPNCGAKMEME